MRMAKNVSNMGSPFPSSRHIPSLSWLRANTQCIQTVHYAPSTQEIKGNSWSFYHPMYHDGKNHFPSLNSLQKLDLFETTQETGILGIKRLDFFSTSQSVLFLLRYYDIFQESILGKQLYSRKVYQESSCYCLGLFPKLTVFP